MLGVEGCESPCNKSMGNEGYHRPAWQLDNLYLATIGFGDVRHDDLRVTLGTSGTALQQGPSIVHTPLVDIYPRLDVIERIYNQVLSTEELICVHCSLSVWRNYKRGDQVITNSPNHSMVQQAIGYSWLTLVLLCVDPQIRIHVQRCLSSRNGLWFLEERTTKTLVCLCGNDIVYVWGEMRGESEANMPFLICYKWRSMIGYRNCGWQRKELNTWM